MVVVLLPVLDESGNIEDVVHELAAVLTSTREDFRILAIDDGSRDGSLAFLHALQRTYPIDLVAFESNRGIGEVLRTGLPLACAKAGRDGTIVFLESDGSNDPGILPAMLAHIRSGVDIVIASRFCEGGSMKGFPVGRGILSRGLSVLIRSVLTIHGITDWSIFFRAYRASLIQRALDTANGGLVRGDGFFANTELLLNLLTFQPRVIEVALPYRYDNKKSTSRMRVFRETAMHLGLLARYRFGGSRFTTS